MTMMKTMVPGVGQLDHQPDRILVLVKSHQELTHGEAGDATSMILVKKKKSFSPPFFC